MTRGLLGWTIGAVIGLAGGLAAALIPGHGDASPRLPPPGDRVSAAIAGVEKDPSHLYVAPELAGLLTPQQLADARRALSNAKAPSYVVFWGGGRFDGLALAGDDGADSDDVALEQLEMAVGKRGFYAIVPYGGLPTDDAIGFGDPFVDTQTGRPADRMVRYAAALAKTAPEAATDDGPSDYWGGVPGGFAAGCLFVLPAYLALVGLVALVGWIWRSWRSP